jgi:serine/threonine protein kinase
MFGDTAKVSDFGLAKATAGVQRHSLQGHIFYRSPEKLAGQAYGPPDDMWAFGKC